MKGRAQSVCVRPYVFTSHLSLLTSHLLKKARGPCTMSCPVRSEPPSEWISPSESPSSMSPFSYSQFFHFFIITFFHYYIFSFFISHLSPLTSPPFPLPIGRAGVGLFSVIRTCGVRTTGAATALRWTAGLLLTRQLAVQLRAQLGALFHG